MRLPKSRSFRSLIATALVVFCLSLGTPVGAMSWSVAVEPGVAFGLGVDARYFPAGYYTTIRGRLGGGGPLAVAGTLEVSYELKPLFIDTSLSLLGAGPGVALRMAVSRSILLRAFGVGGYYYALLNDGRGPRSGGGYAGGGLGVTATLARTFELSLATGYRTYFGLGNFLRVGIEGRLSPGSGEPRARPAVDEPLIRPLAEAADDAVLQITDPVFKDVFPVFFKSYDEHPIGSAQLTNVGSNGITGLSVDLLIRSYMDNPTACHAPKTLAPGESAGMDIRGFFNESVLSIEEATKVSAELIVRYECDGERVARTYTDVVRLHDRNAMTWDDSRRPAAYITPKDGSVLRLSRAVSGVVRSSAHGALNPTLSQAIAMHTALALHGMTYTRDPASPYRAGDAAAVDYLQFPRQTLEYGAGDCDDLSILWCALFESVDISTAMILIPGHIFMAVDLGIGREEARAQFDRVDDLIMREDTVWLPIEVTSISDGFLHAWRTGARQWREAVAREQAQFVETAAAWERYEPVGLPASSQSLAISDESALSQAYEREIRAFIDATIYPTVARIQHDISSRGRAPALVNRLAILYARYGLYDRARSELEELLAERPDYAPGLANLATVEMLSGDLVRADTLFRSALASDPDNPSIMIGLARVSHRLENYGTSAQMIERVRELDPGLADRHAHLALRDDGVRASAAGEEMPVWVDTDEEER